MISPFASRRRSDRHRPWSVTKLEQRLLLAGDAGAAVSAPTADAAAEVASQSTAVSSEVVVFVDSAVSELTDVATPIAEGAELVLLRADADGVEQIRTYLARRTGIREVHIVSHGSAGRLQLGSTEVNEANLTQHAANIRGWGDALAAGADVLLYGCDVAADPSGMNLVRQIARLSGADVAASTDRTANAEQQGDWDLEFHVGQIESTVALTPKAIESFNGYLAISDGLIGYWTLDDASTSNPITDLSGFENDGQALNFGSQFGPSSDTADIGGPNSGSFRFDGQNDYIAVAEDESLRLTNGTYSQSLWLKSSSTDNLYHGVIGQQVGPLAGTRYPFIYVRNDAIYAGFGTGGNTWKGVIADGVVPINEWNHVAVTFDGSSMELFVNGESVATNNNFGGSLPTTALAQLSIGRVNNQFAGNIDEVRMYDRALTTEEVETLAGTGDPPVSGPGVIDLESSQAAVNEGSGSITLTLQRTDGTDGVAEVFYRTNDGSAVAGSDFDGVSSDSVVFADGQASATIEIQITDDSEEESVESFEVELLSVTGAALGSTTTATVNINDDDAEISTDGLIAYWNLNETSTSGPIADSSGLGNNGQALNFAPPNGPSNDAPDIGDPNPGSFRFDGVNDYIDVSESDSLRLTNGTYTQALWINSSSTDDLYHGVIGYQAGPLAGTRYPFIYVRNDAIYAGFGTGGNTWKGVVADGAISINEWTHVAVTFDGDSMELLVNGDVVATNSNFGGSLPTTAVAQLSVGRVNTQFAGKLDEVRMYNRALSESEIEGLMDEGDPPVSGPGLIGIATTQVTVNENAGTVSVGLRRYDGTDGPAEVFYTTQDDTAIDGEDYIGTTNGSVQFTDGQEYATIDIPLIDNDDTDGDLSFKVSVFSVTGAVIGEPRTSTVTIVDNESASGLIGYWDLNEETITGPIADSSGFGNNGDALNFVAPNGPSSIAPDTQSPNSGSFGFDGANDFIGVAEDDSLRLTEGRYSQAAWIRPTTYDNNWHGVIGYQVGASVGTRYPFIYQKNDAIYAGFGTGGNTWQGVVADNVLTLNTWNHIAVTFDGSTMELHVNGEVVGTNSDFGGAVPTTTVAELNIGVVNPNTHFLGQIDEVRMYDRAISGSEIQALIDGATLPPPNVVGFFTTEVVASGFVQPTTIERLPDGRFYVAEREGIIRVVNEDGSVNSTPLLDINDIVNRVGVDRGLMSIALPPDFATSRQIYVAYTYDPPEVQGETGAGGPDGEGGRVARVSRFTVSADGNVADRDSEVVVLGTNSLYEHIGQPNRRPLLTDPQSGLDQNGDYIPDFIASDELSHTIGDMEFGTDGALYVSTGDGGSYGRVDPVNLRALDIDSLNGKILRVDPLTGQGLSDNPFWDGDPGSNASRVYSYGLRNPFRFAINPADGEVFIADVGWLNWEEINTGRGANFGWPVYEGIGFTGGDRGSYTSLPEVQDYLDTNPVITPPIWTRSHAQGGTAIIMGDFVDGGDYPASLQGSFLFTDIGDQVLRAGRLDGNGQLIDVVPVSSALGFITDVMRMSDGSLYYVDFVSGTIGRLVFNE